MFIKRTRSAIRGPTQRQTYVPHDQRQINSEPTPIKTEKMAQYYLRQLINMGYLDSYPYIVTIKPKDPTSQIHYEMDYTDQSMGANGNVNSTNMEVVNIFGSPYSNPIISNDDILNRNGCKLYPIIATNGLGFLNGTDSGKSIDFRELDSNNSYSTTVSAHNTYLIANRYSYFTQAYPSASGNKMFYTLHIPNNTGDNFDCGYCNINSFFLVCKELTVLVVMT